MRGAAPRRLDRDGVLDALASADGVAILPTDTVPGLHARVDRPEALARLGELKQRRADQSFVVLCADTAAALGLAAEASLEVVDYLGRLWPGPFSAILAAKEGLPPAIVAPAGTVALRVPRWEPLRELLRRSGPLASTSVNRRGETPATDLAAAAAVFPGLPCWQTAEAGGSAAPSALVDLTGGGPQVLRPGPEPPPSWGEGA